MNKIIFAAIIIIAACNEAPSEAAVAETPSASTDSTANKFCYARYENQDTVLLNLVFLDSLVTGDLSYRLHEKDKNNGKIRGVLKGDTIFADYTFLSEGTSSVREIVFLRKDNEIVEGFGEVEEHDGKMKFKKGAAIEFGGSMVLKAIECK
jgi:hypothetical protein